MYVKMLRSICNYPADSYQSIPDDVVKGFIDANHAVKVDMEEYTRAAWRTEQESNKADILKSVRQTLDEAFAEFRSANAAGGRRPGPPGGGLNFNDLGNPSVPAHEQDRNLHLGDAMKCMFFAGARGAPQQAAEYCAKRLSLYTEDGPETSVNERGELVQKIVREFPGGGSEVIIRTGTDSISGGSTYGYTLKPNFVDNLFRISSEAQVFANTCRGVPVMQGNETMWPLLNQFQPPTTVDGIPQSAVYGGVQVYFVGETTPRTLTDASVKNNRYKLLDMAAMTSFSRDYIVDNFIGMDSEVTRIFGEAMGWVKDWTYIQGNGVGQPQGFLKANAAIGLNRGNVNEISGDDLATMISRFATMYWLKPGTRFLANVTTLPQLYALKNTAGNLMFQPNATITQDMILSIMALSKTEERESRLIAAPMGTILGIPIYFTEKLPVLGTTGDICLVAGDAYGDATRGGIEMGMSEHYAFNVDEIYYRAKLRLYGKSLWPAAYQQADGSNTTISPFVYLNAAA
jgi:HK97 family phage major capsid protein